MRPRRKPGNNVGRTETYVVCLDCGTEFAYDCKEMRIRESIKNSDSGHLIASPFAALRLHATPVGAVPVEPSLFPGNPVCSCTCGQILRSLSAVGLSVDHRLVIHWRCPKCNRERHVIKPLAECWRDRPKKKNEGLTDSESISDKGFLRDMGIKDRDN